MSNSHKEVDFPRGSADLVPLDIPEDETASAARPWLKSLRSKRAYDALNAGPASRPRARRPSINAELVGAERDPNFVKAAPLELPPHCTGEDALIATVDNCLTQLSANEDCAEAGIDPEGVHQMRVALRRLDAALTLYAALIPQAQLDRLRLRIKSTAEILAPARDWDVFLGEMLAPVASDMPNDPDLKLLRTAARRRRTLAYRDLQRALASRPYYDMWRELAAWLVGREWRQQPVTENSVQLLDDAAGFARTILEKAHRKLLKRGHGFEVLTTRERHKLRIRVKKVRYAAEFFAPLYPGARDNGYISALRAMQDELGRLNDVESARGLIDGLATGNSARDRRLARAGGLIVGWHRHAAAMHEHDAVRQWTKLKKTKPYWR